MEEWIRENAWAVWLGLSMVLGVAELASLDLVLLMLAVGALAGMGAALLDLQVWVQVLAATAASVAMLAFVRPSFVKRLHTGPDLQHGFAGLVGKEAFTVAEITAQGGQIKLAGELWTARPYDETAVIPAGAKVQVFEIRGATAYVHEIPELGF
ncbi:MAG TPA: NfeD family protein [Marmoricola sp.]|nr:NfeD family protein [Marmoricola sp.]